MIAAIMPTVRCSSLNTLPSAPTNGGLKETRRIYITFVVCNGFIFVCFDESCMNATGWGSTFTEGCSCSNCCWNHGCISDLINEKYKWHQFLALDKKQVEYVEMEYHKFPENTFCSGVAFVAKPGGREEDDGWVITFTMNI
ncbi:hypothetical protein L6452_41705 [Arctium lappa]|uniref:Uncharacterized protein n=1 Tax=Arctium lappa TaxID=4217 RepID=A0ACB8XPD9_ARCLA|nr:hypothetical protein L6452_41705 [Arctium lappa]